MENTASIEKLKNRDYVLVIDKSGSMEETDTPTGQTRWDYAKESTLAVAKKITELDPDGITVTTFSSSFKTYENTDEKKVKQIFQENSPMGGTTLAPVLKAAFADFNKRKAAGSLKPNGEIMMVVTDGQPSDETEVAKEIVNFTKTLDNGDDQYGISFIQVGKDAHAAAFLKRLDDNLQSEGAKFDIVDTKTMDELENIGLTEALVAALED